jgi:hypothetical protein
MKSELLQPKGQVPLKPAGKSEILAALTLNHFIKLHER